MMLQEVDEIIQGGHRTREGSEQGGQALVIAYGVG